MRKVKDEKTNPDEIRLYLSTLYPDMDQNRSSPWLLKINGCGCGFWNKRDFDSQTNSYIAIQFLYIIYIPVLPIAAYRVVNSKDNEDSYHVLGKVPLQKGDFSIKKLFLGWLIGLFSISIIVGIIAGIVYFAQWVKS